MDERTTLFYRSIEIIKNYQSPSGAYVASPNFENYQYCWLRDGSYIAHAMDCVGEYQSSKEFYRWVSQAIRRYAFKVDQISSCLDAGTPIAGNDFLHTRYYLNGFEDPGDSGWGNFQVDGYGSWLWAVCTHIQKTEDWAFFHEIEESVVVCLRYLALVYRLPCYDLWEENPEMLHTYSLAAVYGGVQELLRLAWIDNEMIMQAQALAEEVRNFILQYGEDTSCVVKFIEEKEGNFYAVADSGIDASMIGLCTPYGVLSAESEVFKTTMDQIESQLVNKNGGVYRYPTDTYYGGGQWVLLAGWLAWHYTKTGQDTDVQRLIGWIENQADDEFQLPEQVSDQLLFPSYLEYWQQKWGEIAKPLLWSHAMYLIAVSASNE